ncbi:MAG: TetR/AcrR family transcriptional regulator [Actinomycetota bacterium]
MPSDARHNGRKPEKEKQSWEGRNAGWTGSLEAAFREFSKRSFRKTTLEDIARRSDVSKGTFHKYLRDKKDLYRQACDRAFRRWDEWACALAAEADGPAERMRRLGRELHY